MLAVIQPQVFDPRGHLRLDADPGRSSVWAGQRRVSRRQTLDGGVYILDAGYTDGDTTINLICRDYSRDQLDYLQHMVHYVGRIIISLHSGCFQAVLQDYQIAAGELSVTVLIERRLMEIT